jgi:regulator of replication initiation timing
LSQLGLQRDELVENKEHAKSLSFALHNNNVKFGMHQGLMRWSDGAHHKKRLHFEGVLGRNLDQISGLKDKVNELEEDNESLALQNEEMRQISLDGYQIARNVQNLNSEREKLSVDLADKTSMIKRLLDENEKLRFRLRQAQDDVDSLRMTRAH